MFKLIDRYLLKEIFPPFFVGMLVYTFVMLMHHILLFSEMYIDRGVSFRIVLKLFVYLLPSILAFTLPMSVLLGILAGLSRMSSDVEVTAMRTLGIGSGRILRPILVFSICGWLITSALTLYLAPQANYRWVQTVYQEVVRNVQFEIKPRVFNESLPHMVIYFQDIMPERTWENIFVHLSEPPSKPRVITASYGRLQYYPESKKAYLELRNGALHSYPRVNPEEYSVTFFDKLEEEIDVASLIASAGSAPKGVREKDIHELLRDMKELGRSVKQGPDEADGIFEYDKDKRSLRSHWVEAHKRFAIPFSCLIFAFLGLPLGASTRRGGRTSGFTVSIAFILIYYILITAGEQMALEGRVAPWLGIWTPNILFSAAAVYFYMKSIFEFSLFSALVKKIRHLRSKDVSRTAGERRLSFPFPNILDRYVIRKYMFIFSLSFLSMTAIFIIVTFFERIASIYENEKSLSLLFEYIGYSLPNFIYTVLPAAALVSTLLGLGLLTKFNEITAMKACGISLYRTVLPVVAAAVLLSAFSFYLQENVVPYANKKADEIWDEIRGLESARSDLSSNLRWVMGKSKNRIYHYREFNPTAGGFRVLSIYDLDTEAWTLKRRIFAESAVLREGNLALDDFWLRRFVESRPIDFVREDNLTLPVQEDQGYFVKKRKIPEQMSFGELRSYIHEIEEKNFESRRYRIDLHYKISFPLAVLVMTILGIPFAFTMGRRGALFGLGLSLLIAMVYWGAIGIFKSLGYVNYLSPYLAAWGPTMIFSMVGLYFLFRART